MEARQGATLIEQRSEQGEHEALAHILPNWFQRFQEVAFLPLMIVAEMLINGVMMASGLVGDVNNPFAGGLQHWLAEATWVALFLAGAVMGGMAIRTSAASSYWFSRNAARALFNVAGMLGFVALEVWASVMERSYNPIISPVDKATLAWFGVAHPSVSITDVVVALALPLAAMFWGFSAMKPAVKSAAEVRAEGERKIAEAEAKARVRVAQAAGWGATLRAGTQAAFARKGGGQDDDSHMGDGASFAGQDGHVSSDSFGRSDGDTDPHFAALRGGGDGASFARKDEASARNLRTLAQGGSVPVGWLDKTALMDWLREGYGVETSPDDALAFIKAQNGARQCSPEEKVQGRPWIAPKAQTLAAARRKWGPRPASQVSGA